MKGYLMLPDTGCEWKVTWCYLIQDVNERLPDVTWYRMWMKVYLMLPDTECEWKVTWCYLIQDVNERLPDVTWYRMWMKVYLMLPDVTWYRMLLDVGRLPDRKKNVLKRKLLLYYDTWNIMRISIQKYIIKSKRFTPWSYGLPYFSDVHLTSKLITSYHFSLLSIHY
jgi:hypothetical protein